MSTSYIATKVVASALTVAQAATVYTSSMAFGGSAGDVAVILATTAGTIAVSQQCSLDNVNWYDPVDAAGAAKGAVVAAQGVTTGKYITFSPVISNWARFKIIEANVAGTVVTITLATRTEI